MTKHVSSLRPLIELTLASVFWGFGFPATIWVLQSLNFPAVIMYRFFGAFCFGMIIVFIRGIGTSKKELLHEFKISRTGGFWLAATLILQTWGLLTTSATKSAFLTVLYVVFVPLLAALIDREKLSIRNTFCLIGALIGTVLIVNITSFSLSPGDALTLGNAFTAACHIRVMGRLAPMSNNHFTFNVFQCLWTGLFALPLGILQLLHPPLFSGGWNLFAMSSNSWIGMASLIFGSSLLAFFLQVRAQQKLSATVAALLFLMESPFSALFGAWFLAERLTSLQLLGAVCIFGSCIAASLPKKMPVGAHP